MHIYKYIHSVTVYIGSCAYGYLFDVIPELLQPVGVHNKNVLFTYILRRWYLYMRRQRKSTECLD